MLRLLIAAIVLLGAAYFMLAGDESGKTKVPPQQQEMQKAAQVQNMVNDQAAKMHAQIDAQMEQAAHPDQKSDKTDKTDDNNGSL